MPTNRLTKLFNDGITVEEHGDFQIINGVYVHKSHKMRVRLDPPEHSFDCECQNCRDCEPITFMDDCGDDVPYSVDKPDDEWQRGFILGLVTGALAFALFISLCRL